MNRLWLHMMHVYSYQHVGPFINEAGSVSARYECVEIVGESFVVAHDACLFLSACGAKIRMWRD